MNKKVLFGFAVSAMAIGIVAATIANKKPAVEANAAVNANYSSIFLAGSMNDWIGGDGRTDQDLSNYGKTYGFTYDHASGDDHFYTLVASFTQGQTFQIYDHEHNLWNNYWSDSISNELLSGGNGSGNITCLKTGVYQITYRYTSGTDKQITGFAETEVTAATQINSWAQDFLSDTATICSTDGEDANHFDALNNIWADEAADGATSYSVAGSFTNWTTNAISMKRVGESSVYRLSDIYLAKWSKFKVLKDGSEWIPSGSGNDIEIPSAGYYRIEINSSNNNISYTRMRYIKASYGDLPAAAKELFVSNSSNPNVAEAYARYVHIVTRYELDNFAGITLNPGAASQAEFKENNTFSAPIVISIVAAATVGAGAFFFLRKRKEQ